MSGDRRGRRHRARPSPLKLGRSRSHRWTSSRRVFQTNLSDSAQTHRAPPALTLAQPAGITMLWWSRRQRASNLTATWQICGNISANPWRPRHPSPSRIRREKTSSCRMKIPRRGFAFGSSQRNRMTLTFGAARFWRPGLSTSPGFRFCITQRGMRAAACRLMPLKCFRQRWILERARPRAASCGSSA
ncbi:MAG: hypothetical protein QOJ86_1716 [Bradyrhizobium sp.]|nr:hypothetical protein [Bradyrhizobium sp.]